VVEHLNHLGIWASSPRRVGTATTALVLNGLGFSNHRLSLVLQFIADNLVERLVGPACENCSSTFQETAK
jgi:hypothetical protein